MPVTTVQYLPRSVRERQIFNEIGEAFATLVRHQDYIPQEYCVMIGDLLSELMTDSHWSQDPEQIRQLIPLFIAGCIKQKYTRLREQQRQEAAR
jgi:hypothetical protein